MHDINRSSHPAVVTLPGPPQWATGLRWHVAIGFAALAALQSTVALVSAERSSRSDDDILASAPSVLAAPQPYRCAASVPSAVAKPFGGAQQQSAMPSTGAANVRFQWGPEFADSVCNSLCGGAAPSHTAASQSSDQGLHGDRGGPSLTAAEIAAIALVTGMSLMGCAYSVKLLCRKQCKCWLCSGHYKARRRLGSGGYGEVYLLSLASDKRELFAAKKIAVSNVTEADSFSSEAKELVRLHHRYIVSYIDDFIHVEHTLWGVKVYFFILMEYCSNGDVKQQVELNFDDMTEAMVLKWFKQLCQAVQYLHSQNVIHRDIKSQNVFLTENGDVRLGDFGLCKRDKIEKRGSRGSGGGGRLKKTLKKPLAFYRKVAAASAVSSSSDSVQVGTDCYMSPEMLCSAECGKPGDVWGLGCVLFEMCSGKFMWELDCNIGLSMVTDKSSPSEVYSMMMSYMSPHVSPSTRSLVKKILDPDPRTRPTIAEILRKKVLKRGSRSALSVRFGSPQQEGWGLAKDGSAESEVDTMDDGSTSSSPTTYGVEL
ncbi:hypothetical protein FOL47_010397 [Perkinsus chesapeaki]|uniref:Protein kinase domain-containing protein n=1 Tax=Perkinsus chesapeaki TaxID=330153 RepID=A0A7J6MQR8_PERCH|nr:hypothetical protein FOL47_010397 [Perkinsus chesapeaki]